jgi:hypothetical protein
MMGWDCYAGSAHLLQGLMQAQVCSVGMMGRGHRYSAGHSSACTSHVFQPGALLFAACALSGRWPGAPSCAGRGGGGMPALLVSCWSCFCTRRRKHPLSVYSAPLLRRELFFFLTSCMSKVYIHGPFLLPNLLCETLTRRPTLLRAVVAAASSCL